MMRLYVQISLLVLLAVSMLGCTGCRTSVEPEDPISILIPPPRDYRDDNVTSTSDPEKGDGDKIGRPETPEGQGAPVPVPLSLMTPRA